MVVRKPLLSFWQIWNMSFGFLGIQFGFALQNANVSRIFQTLGASIEDIPILWIAAPLTGLIVQPIIGYMSDRTWNRLGRRRPYFLTGAILASLALIIMPNSPELWVAAGMLWILDASINISMEPFRAFVGDNLPEEQRTMGFAMQSFFIGTGAVIASLLPLILTEWLGFENTAEPGQIPSSVKWSFYLGAIVFLIAVIWTVTRSFEYSPEQLKKFQEARREEDPAHQEKHITLPANLPMSRFLTPGGISLTAGLIVLIWLLSADAEKELFILAFGLIAFGMLLMISAMMNKAGRQKNALLIMMSDLLQMPGTMKQLAWVQFFSWFALFSMWIYTTAAVTSHVYGTTDTSSEAYNAGANWVGTCFAVYNGVAAIVAFLLPVFARRTNRKLTHAICLLLGSAGLISIFFISTPGMLLISMVGIGCAWASILSMPYAILTGSLPAAKMGYFMGVFNFFIVIPQIVAATILGFIVGKVFESDAVYALIIGGCAFIVAAVLTMFVYDPGEKIIETAN